MSYIRWFEDTGAGDIAVVGGKGANLGEMVQAGFPVPPGFCLVAPAYRDFIAGAGLYEQIEAILAGAGENDEGANALADMEAKTRRIRQLIVERPLPEGISSQLLDAYRQLAGLADKFGLEVLPVAIRSSATAEDLPTASFAGQQDTYLNVRGEQALLDHVSRCWASLWSARAVAYREKQGFDHKQVAISVVVQAMIPSEISGILFTANPINGRRREVVVNGSWGLGEAIVSGLVSPDTITASKEDGKILDYQLADKEQEMVYLPDGGIEEQPVPETRRRAEALGYEQVAQLVELGRKIEDHYGKPQDIEWGYARGEWYILQSRPITTLPAGIEGADPDIEYNRTMFIEIFPDPLSPVFLSVIAPLFTSMLDFTFITLGFEPPKDMAATGVFYNQPYFSRNYIETALSTLSPSVRDGLVSQIVNPFGRHEQRASGELSLVYARMAWRTLKFMILFPRRLPGLVSRYRTKIQRVAELPLESMPDEEISAEINDIVLNEARRLLDADFLLIAVIGRTYQLLGSILERYYGVETQELVAKLVSGVTGNVTMETNKRIWDLAEVAKKSEKVSEILRQYDDQEALARLELEAGARPFLDSMDAFLKEYGHREIRMDILYPTWIEDPGPVLGFIRGYLDLDESQGPYAQQERLVREREELTSSVLQRVVKGVTGRFIISPIFRWLLEKTQFHTRERDTMHFELTRIFPPLRQALLVLAHRWQEQGYLSQEDDIYYLSLDEISDIARSPHEMTETVQARREELETNRSRIAPYIIRDGQELMAKRAAAEVVGDGLHGVAGSPGTISGLARVINDPSEFGRLQKGEILVAPITNPVWTPLFAVAGGLVTEVGGMLSHGAIVAREYGIPAVMSVPSATSLIEDGQPVTVDGNQGVVVLSGAPEVQGPTS